MEHEHSAEDLEVARILKKLPHLIWEAEYVLPCTHSLRWGARKRRSAGNDEAQPPSTHSPALVPPRPRPPPLHHPAPSPPAVERLLNKKRRVASTKPCSAAATFKEAAPTRAAVRPEEPAAATETSSPETPLDFCGSGEEPEAKGQAPPLDHVQPPKKKPKTSRKELAKQMDSLIHTRTELQKEVEEARNRLQALRWRHSELLKLRIKLEEESDRRQPTCAVRSITRAHDHVIPGSLKIRRQQPCQYPWLLDNHPVVHQPPTAFSVHQPSLSLDHQTAPPPGKHHFSWVVSQPLGLAGDKDGARLYKVPDLNARGDEELAWS